MRTKDQIIALAQTAVARAVEIAIAKDPEGFKQEQVRLDSMTDEEAIASIINEIYGL